jgi:hypothetical protein
MRFPYGRGEVLYVQLDLTDRIGREPAADRIAANLIACLDQPLDMRPRKNAVCLDEAAAAHIEALGFAAEARDQTGDTAGIHSLDPARYVLAILGGQADLLAPRRSEVSRFIDRGGDLLVLYAGDALLGDELFGGRVRVAPSRVHTNLVTTQAHPLLRGVGPQNLHWRVPVDLMKLESSDPAFVSLLDGLAGVLQHGEGRIVFLQTDPARMTDLTAARELDPLAEELDPKTNEPKHKPLTDARLRLDRTRSLWHVNRLHSLLLGNLGLGASEALVARIFEVKPTMTQSPVNEWVILGPFPPQEENPPDPLDRSDLAETSSNRDVSFTFRNREGGTTRWFAPNDMMHGLGQNGKNDLGMLYGVKLGQAAVAVTHIWSTRERTAEIGLGADWWLKVFVNGDQVLETTRSPWTFGINFDRKVNVPLKAGWNEVVCHVASGSNGHILWFEIDNPGDVRVAQTLTPPEAPPESLPPVEDLVPPDIDPGFELYTEPMTGKIDPYSYHPW